MPNRADSIEALTFPHLETPARVVSTIMGSGSGKPENAQLRMAKVIGQVIDALQKSGAIDSEALDDMLLEAAYGMAD